GGAHDAGRLGDAAIGPVLLAVGHVEGHQLVVDVDDIDPLARHRRRAVDRQIDRGAPQLGARVGVERRHDAITGRDEDLAAADGQTAAEAAAARPAAEADAQDAATAIDFLDLDAGLPRHLASAGVDGGHARLAVQHEYLAAVGDD